MNPITFAMRRPFTVMVLVVAVVLGSVLAVTRMAIDIFPNLNLPVIYVAQPYGGMDPAQMEGPRESQSRRGVDNPASTDYIC